jgi:hypothetical protein
LWFDNWIDYDNDVWDSGIYLEYRVGTTTAWTKYGPFNYGHSSSSTDRTYPITSDMWGTSQSIQFRVVSPNGSSDSWEGIFIDNVRSVCN